MSSLPSRSSSRSSIYVTLSLYRDLLHKYSTTKDVLIHVGDIVTKGPHKDSMALLTYLASNNITGVRGNNDQKVVEWRGWLNWIVSLPDGKAWLDHLEKVAPSSHADKRKLLDWMKDQRKAASKEDKKWWRRIPDKWVLFSDHYKVARDMSATEFQYLLDLPLRLYVPSAHVFIVHAGLLSSDPQYPYYDKRQPLARVPKLMATSADTSNLKKTKNEVESLRRLQDLSLLTLVPQNLIPWVILNIRGVKNGEVTKKNKKGKPWSDLWNLEMERCVGYNEELLHGAVDGDSKEISARKKESEQALPCYPSTVIYGHAAARGLDLKRWSIGLDTGCVSTFFRVS
jgi:Calcineurin-like phosphoesterase